MATETSPAQAETRPLHAQLLAPFDSFGAILAFAVRAFAGIPRSFRYVREIWWYAAFLAIGSTPVALVITYISGSECSVEGYYSLAQLGGAQSLVGIFNALCDTREITPLFFGFAIGAKVGCGIVAELGTMRINQEIDALETMGIPSVVYLVSTRVVASVLVLPIMYVFALDTSYIASWLVQRFQFGSQVSAGVYFDYFWRFTNLTDLGFSVLKAAVFAIIVIVVAVYQGYYARGGAVGIGRAVARTMALSLVLVVVFNAVMTMIFWGHNPNFPIPT